MVVNKSSRSKACLEYIQLKQNKKTLKTLTEFKIYCQQIYFFKKKKKRKEKGGRQGERSVAIRFFKKHLVATARANGSKLFEDIIDNTCTSNCVTQALNELDFTIPLIRRSFEAR